MPGFRMFKFLSFLFVCAFLLTACQGSPATGSASTQPVLNSATVVAQITETASETCYYFQQPTPNPNEPSLFAPVSLQDHIQGPANAYLTILEYSDFQCTACAAFAATLASIRQKHPQDIRIVYRSFPLITLNDKAALAMQAAEAAHLQGKLWEMHDLLFEKQADWIKLDAASFRAWLGTQAASLGLDAARFDS